ncbi:MAG TPA: nucleotidyltransferase domain-containing protein [Gaiellaceae bacterium]|nr:nucleotidyltransferase domain-containing protein [Gaiellaceae bacterium]
MSVAQVAERLGITRQAVLKRIHRGRLPAVKVGRAYVVPADALAESPVEHDRVLREIVRRLTEAYEPERVYLFGSAARGDADEGSDYDVLLVVPDDAPAERVRARRAYEALWGIGAAVDVVVWRRSAFDTSADAPTSLPAIVLREGVLLHAA